MTAKSMDTILEAKNVKKYFSVSGRKVFPSRRGKNASVDGVSFKLHRCETLGIAGESGCGKTTLAKLLLRLYPLSGGEVRFNDTDIATLKGGSLRSFRRNAQMVFQDPYDSLNPRFTVKESLLEPPRIHKMGSARARIERVREIMDEVGLAPARRFLDQYPHQLSGGQRQRVAIARAVILHPKFLIADEPVSMLDLSIRAGILKLLQKLTTEKNISTICISHDLSLLRYLCDRVAIMYAGRLVEIGPTESIIHRPLHPYSKALLKAVPHPDPDHQTHFDIIKGDLSDTINVRTGCHFFTRCVHATKNCQAESPTLKEIENRHQVACHLFQSQGDKPGDVVDM